MAKGTQEKVERNRKLYAMKNESGMSFTKIAKIFQISSTMAKNIYYRERKREKQGVGYPLKKKVINR